MAVSVDVLVATPIWEALADGLVLIGPDGSIVAVNSMFCSFVGCAAGDLVGQDVQTLVPAGRRAKHAELMAGYNDEPHARSMRAGGRLELVGVDGSAMPVLIALSPIDTDAGPMVIASVRDDTERAHAERRLAVATRDRMLVEARERTARDLHDVVIAELFAAGVSLEAVMGAIPEGVARDRAESTVEALDRVITAVRNAITGFRAPPTRSLSGRLLEVVSDITPALVAAPVVDLDTRIDAVVPDRVADQVVTVIGEALTNVARHADAHEVSVTVRLVESALVVEVLDDGIGIDPTASSTGGIANLTGRARELGGECEASVRPDGGTSISWRVPLTIV